MAACFPPLRILLSGLHLKLHGSSIDRVVVLKGATRPNVGGKSRSMMRTSGGTLRHASSDSLMHEQIRIQEWLDIGTACELWQERDATFEQLRPERLLDVFCPGFV
ncbi:MAG: hypothetical protein ACYDER_02710 [Ktedonobacteraceae bacterium]